MTFWQKFLKGAAFALAVIAAWGLLACALTFLWSACKMAAYFTGLVF